MICQGLNVAQKTQSGGLCSPDKQEFGHTPLGSQTAAAKGSGNVRCLPGQGRLEPHTRGVPFPPRFLCLHVRLHLISFKDFCNWKQKLLKMAILCCCVPKQHFSNFRVWRDHLRILTNEDSDSAGLGQGLRICFSNKLSSRAETGALGGHLE